MIQRVIEDQDNRVWPVTNLLDIYGNETNDLSAAVSMVVKLADDQWLSDEIGLILIHTVH